MFRRAATLLFVLPATLAGLVGVIWYAAARIAENQIETSIAREARLGRVWSCGERETSGFPFEIVVRCGQPRLEARKSKVGVSAAMAAITARASVLNPWSVEAKVDGPLTMDLSDGRRVAARWRNLRVALEATTQGPDIALSGSGLEIRTTGFEDDWERVSAEELAARARPIPDRAADARVWNIALDVAGARAQPLDKIAGNTAPADLRIDAHVSEVDPYASGSLLSRIEDWRQSGGRISIVAASARKGDTRGSATGELSLDDERRPMGRIDAQLAGLEPVLKQLGLGAGALAIEGLVRGMFSRRTAAQSQEPEPALIPLPIRLQNGRVSIGPMKTPIVLRSLY